MTDIVLPPARPEYERVRAHIGWCELVGLSAARIGHAADCRAALAELRATGRLDGLDPVLGFAAGMAAAAITQAWIRIAPDRAAELREPGVRA